MDRTCVFGLVFLMPGIIQGIDLMLKDMNQNKNLNPLVVFQKVTLLSEIQR